MGVEEERLKSEPAPTAGSGGEKKRKSGAQGVLGAMRKKVR